MVTDEQVRLLRRKRMNGKSQEASAAAAGMSVRTARVWERGALPSQTRKKRSWRTRNDPFDGVWALEIEPLLRAGLHVLSFRLPGSHGGILSESRGHRGHNRTPSDEIGHRASIANGSSRRQAAAAARAPRQPCPQRSRSSHLRSDPTDCIGAKGSRLPGR